MPGRSGLKTCVGGCSCAWYIQPGSIPKTIVPESTIEIMAYPRRASKA
jgi:hypothetical protein